MQRFNIDVIEHRKWRVPVDAKDEAEAIKQLKKETRKNEAYLIESHFEVVRCSQVEK